VAFLRASASISQAKKARRSLDPATCGLPSASEAAAYALIYTGFENVVWTSLVA
jgi:hypothetical protein